MKKALITGITGQDGSYLAEFLLRKNYEVHGVVRRSSLINTHRIDHIFEDIHLHYGDVSDAMSIFSIIQMIEPDEIYNLAAQSHVKVSFEMPVYTGQVDALGAVNVLESVRLLEYSRLSTRIYQASSSEMFGGQEHVLYDEKSPFNPRSPYACAKVYAYHMTKNYREAHGLFASSGILFNHESPRRGETFVTRKIVQGLSHICAGMQDCITLGNLDAQRDWGHAADYVHAMWLILQHDDPDDFVIATGETHSVREFVESASKFFGINIEWKYSGVREIGVDKRTGKTIIKVDPKYFRPTEVDVLRGNAGKAMQLLGWSPEITFDELVEDMCLHGY